MSAGPVSLLSNVRLLASVLLALGTATATACESVSEQRTVGDVDVLTIREEYASAHLVRRNGHTILIDAGLERHAEVLEQRLFDNDVDPASIEAIILTHGHADHAGGARLLQERYGIPVVVGVADQVLLDDGVEDDLCPTDDIGRDRLRDNGFEVFTPYVADLTVLESMDLREIVDMPGRIVSIPGHTDGSLTVVVDEAAFVGDLFRGDIFSATATVHFYMCDLDDNRRDIEDLLKGEAADVTTFFPGHFGPIDRGSVEDLVANTDAWSRAKEFGRFAAE